MWKEPRRARRTRHTRRVAAQRRSEYTRRMLGGDPSGNRRVERSPNYWAKVGIGSCTCRKRHHGAPRRDKGMCDLGARSRVYRMRAEARELNRVICRGADPEGDVVALLTSHPPNDLW